MNFELLRTFVEVHRSGGMRGASEALHLTQPAISIRIRELESQFGLLVFERLGRRLHLTDAGRLLLEESVEVLQRHDTMVARMDAFKNPDHGFLRLATIDAASIYVLPQVFVRFRQLRPQVELSVRVTDSLQVSRCVRELDADIGFVALANKPPRPKRNAELSFEHVFEDRLVVVATPTHALCKKRSVSLADIAQSPLILYEKGSTTRKILDHEFDISGTTPKIAMQTASPEAMKRLAEAGVGISILPHELVQREVEQGRLQVLPLRGVRFVRWIAMVQLRNRSLSPHGKDFVRLVREETQNTPT